MNLQLVHILLGVLTFNFYVYFTICGYVDDDTPTPFHIIERHHDGKQLKLIMSDEFEKAGRGFTKGFDPFFESVDKPDNSNQALQYCKSNFTCFHLLFFSKYIYTHILTIVIILFIRR